MKPGDFFIGVIDFVAVMVPGSIAAGAVHRLAGGDPFESVLPVEESWQSGLKFAVVAYFLGRLLFLAGSALDPLYEWRRKRLISHERDTTYTAACAARIRLSPNLPGEDFTTFKWAKAFLQLRSPAARAEVEQLEASSKFFRGLTVLFVLLAGGLLLTHRPLPALASAVAAYGCFRGFFDQRWKSTELAFACAVLAESEPKKPAVAEPPEEK